MILADKKDERRNASARLNTPSSRGFTLDRFEQEVANEIGIGRDRLPATGRQGTAGGQGVSGGQGAARNATSPQTGDTKVQPDDERK